MADTNQEQLLNELIRGLRAADEHAGAADLEPRVMAAWEARQRVRPKPGTTHYLFAIAAAVLVGIAVSLVSSKKESPLPPVGRPAPLVAAINTPIAVPPGAGVQSPIPQSPIPQSPIAQSPIPQSPMEFVPLMPLTPHELSGPFQIVRVQMPRASLGAMAPPFEYPGPIVEADVLLGEDGMARAIRISTGGSDNPWRSR